MVNSVIPRTAHAGGAVREKMPTLLLPTHDCWTYIIVMTNLYANPFFHFKFTIADG